MSALTGSCRHYGYENGMVCAKGMDIIALYGNVLACCRDPKKACPAREEYTADELAAAEEQSAKQMEDLFTVIRAIVAEDKTAPGDSGSVACPKCGAGNVDYLFSSSNGHLHAVCSTPKCFEVHQ
ncbi:hypothetical protein QMT40_003003 [Parvibaculaceae bacterium PLY_AMNH_Bact1]|nr:hypothetical protein QMT40_003003 [Parvibaculaceae bacterium PLY_AMNH_Bact1]